MSGFVAGLDDPGSEGEEQVLIGLYSGRHRKIRLCPTDFCCPCAIAPVLTQNSQPDPGLAGHPIRQHAMEPPPSLEPDLLVATVDTNGTPLSRNTAWTHLLGGGSVLWSRLSTGDQELAARNLKEALGGSLVTHALFMIPSRKRDIPTPVLMHFVPVPDAENGRIRAVSLTGEVLSEPTTWTESQTQRHRMETLGRMTMGMAHDFNNLLSGILGHLELWRLESPPTSSQEAHLDTIESAASSGADLIARIQRYIRQEAQSSF